MQRVKLRRHSTTRLQSTSVKRMSARRRKSERLCALRRKKRLRHNDSENCRSASRTAKLSWTRHARNELMKRHRLSIKLMKSPRRRQMMLRWSNYTKLDRGSLLTMMSA